jgi:hypothetical protein
MRGAVPSFPYTFSVEGYIYVYVQQSLNTISSFLPSQLSYKVHPTAGFGGPEGE